MHKKVVVPSGLGPPPPISVNKNKTKHLTDMATVAMAADNGDLEQTYDIVERDTVPAPAPRPDDSFQKRIANLIKWLDPTDFLSPGNEFMKHLHSHVPGTGTWVQGSHPFRAWAGLDRVTTRPESDAASASADDAGSHRCLHVRGVAGSGKSVFAAHTVRQLQDTGAVVLFFFFRQIVDKNHTARYLVRDFAAQLLPHCPALVTALTALSQERGISGSELDLVWPALVEALMHGPGLAGKPVFCVVDALDEIDDGEFDGTVEKLVALGTSTANRDAVRVMMTSRPLPHIQRALDHPGVMRLKLDPTLLYPDVARYVDARLATLDPPLSGNKNDLVRQTICERANGLFLQARLMTDNLVEGLQDGRITEETLPDSLDRLPRTLRAVYEGLLKEHARRSGVTAEDQAKILLCVTHARRPLRLTELASLLSRMLDIDLRRGKDLVRAGCGRLLEILEDETVSVIHHSFTEFLHDTGRQDDKDCVFPVLEDAYSHAMLALLSLEYLSGCPHVDITIDDEREGNYEDLEFSRDEKKRRSTIRAEIRVDHPLASYAADNLFLHMGQTAPSHPATDQMLTALDRYLVPGNPAFENLVLVKWDGPLSASFSVLHLVSALPMGECIPEHVMEHLVEREQALLDSRDADGLTPLGYAAKRGDCRLAAALLAKGANPILGSNCGRTPLHHAAGKGHVAVVRLLLNAGVDPLIKTDPVLCVYDPFEGWYEYSAEAAEARRETALSHAFEGDHAEVVKAFMPFVPPDQINLCFHQVCKVENIKTVLETGKVDIDCFMGGKTKLFRAAQTLKPDVIRLLLQHGADPTRRCLRNRPGRHDSTISMTIPHPDSEQGPTPLHALAGHGYDSPVVFGGAKEKAMACLRLLIEAGADINATMDDGNGKEYLTPLHLAVQQRAMGRIGYWGSMDQSEEILTKILLSEGADPNAKTKRGDRPIHLANTEKPRIVELLVQHGADINAGNARGRSPLVEMINQVAYKGERSGTSIKVFNMLLDLGADLNVADDNGNTIFHHIFHSIAVLAKNPDCIPFLERLLRAGADVNAKNKKGEPPLFAYNQCSSNFSGSTHRHEDEVLRMLVGAGLDLNARDREGRTILWVVGSSCTDVDMMDKFVRLGADPGAVTFDGTTLFHLAVKHSRSPEWFRYLLSAGAKPDVVGKDGDTLVHSVLRKTETYWCAQEVIQFLIEECAVPPLAKNAKGQTALHVAGTVKHLDMVLNTPAFKGLDVNDPDIDGFSPLHHAVALGEQAVWTLLRAGADPAALATGSLSPLHVAARSGEANVAGLLLARYRELNVLEEHVNLLGEGRAPLHYACRSGSPEVVWYLLHNGADASIRDDNGLTPLHALAEFDAAYPPPMAEVIAMLQRAGADLTAEAAIQTEDGSLRMLTPLDVAVERRCWGMVRALLARGVELRDEHKRSEDFVLATDRNKAAERALECQGRASESGVSSRRGRGRRWLGRWSAGRQEQASPEEVAGFVTSGQDILDIMRAQKPDAKAITINVVDVLSDLLRDGDYDSIKEYVRLGGDVIEPQGSDKGTFLHHLVDQDEVELLEDLGHKVAELEAQEWVQKDKDSRGTLLGTACERKQPSLRIIQLLVDKLGVDVNAVYNTHWYCNKLRGASALHILACGSKFWQIEALEYLLSKGADMEARNADGMTPLLAAIDKEWPDGFWKEETVRVLLRHGADANATVMKRSRVPARSALEISGHPGVTRLLLEHGARVERCLGLLTRVVRDWMDPGLVKLLLEAGLDPNELPPEPNEKGQPDKQDGNDEESQQDENEDEYEEELESSLDMRYALHEAARPWTAISHMSGFQARQQAVIELLISHGADAYTSYPDGSFVLQAIVDDRGLLDSFLPQLSQTNCNRRGHHERTLLSSACIPTVPVGPKTYRNEPSSAPTIMVNAINALLDVGADPLAVDNEHRTPLHWFCTLPGREQPDETYRNAFVSLARHGPAAIHMRDKQGRKPLHLALATYASRAQSSPFFIQHLLSAGADPADADPLTGNSALHFIAPRLVGERTSAAAAAALFRELAVRRRLDINARNAAGETPVFAFAAAGWEATRDHPEERDVIMHAEALEDVFVALGADLMAVDESKRTLLHVTAGRRAGVLLEDVKGTFKKLMELGVDPRAEDGQLRTAIDVAVARDLWVVVRLFSEEGRREVENGIGE